MRPEPTPTPPIDPPWKVRSRQEDGRSTERKVANRERIRLHPNSGAGKVKFDGSDDDRVVEIKDAVKSYTLNAAYLLDLFRTAARQGKEAHMIVEFPDITATIIITKKPRR